MENKNFNLNGISKEMKKIATWCYANGKVPCDKNGQYFKNMKREDFPKLSFEEVTTDNNNLGLTFNLRGDIFCIDLDKCFNNPYDNEPMEWAKLIIDFAMEQKVTIEYSKSGLGLHIFCKTSKSHMGFKTLKIKIKDLHKRFEDNDKSGIDIMQNNECIVVTGNLYNNKLNDKLISSSVFKKLLEDINILSGKNRTQIKKTFENNQKDEFINKDKDYINNQFDYIKSEVHLLDLIEKYDIESVNSQSKILCPFHTENTPSFTINTALNLWYCFGCGKGGSVIDFVMLKENCTNFEALKKIAELFEIPMVYAFNETELIDGVLYKNPQGFINDNDGFHKLKQGKDENGQEVIEKIKIQNERFIIVGEYYNNNNKEKGILVKNRNNLVSIPFTELSTRNKIIKALSEKGIKCNDLNYYYFIEYIHEFRDLNDKTWKIVDFTDTLGWVKGQNDKFAPYDNDIILDSSIEDLISTKGDFEEWKKQITELRKNDFFNFVFSSYAFSPLLEPLKRRMIGISHIGTSRIGKTSLAHACMSLWGSPNKLEISGNSSHLALERKASQYKNLPMYFDEKISNGTTKDSAMEFSKMVYGLFNNKQGDKLHSDGTLRTRYTWNNLIHFTAEMPIKRDNMNKGAHTRLMEFSNTVAFNDINQSKDVYKWTKKHYGYGDKVIETIKSIGYEELNKMLDDNVIDIDGKVPDHISSLENAAIGDYILNKMFGLPADINESINRMKKVKSLLIDEKDTQTGNKAIDIVSNYIMMNRHKIEGLNYSQIIGSNECVGKIFGDTVAISKLIIKKELQSNNFDADKVLQDWKVDCICKEEKKHINGSRPHTLIFPVDIIGLVINDDKQTPLDDDNIQDINNKMLAMFKRMTSTEQKNIISQFTHMIENNEKNTNVKSKDFFKEL